MIDQLYQLSQVSPLNPWKRKRAFNRNDNIVWKGDRNSDIFYVKQGSVRILIQEEAEEHTIRFGYQGSIITALDTFLSAQPTRFQIQALKHCILEVATKEDFITFVESNARITKLWLDVNQLLVLQSLEREVDLLTRTPAERYQRVMERSPQLFQEIPAKYIASYLRMTPETLSRLKKS